MGFIEELYFGNLNPGEKRTTYSKEYSKATEIFSDNEEVLTKLLSGEELRIFKDLVEAGRTMWSCGSMENFKTGFRLGVQMMCDSLSFEENEN